MGAYGNSPAGTFAANSGAVTGPFTSRAETSAAPGATLSAATILSDSARRWPDRTALVAGAERITYGSLWRSALRYAAVLRERGIGPGDRVCLLVTNSPHFPMAYFAILALGATVVPVNVLLKTDDIDHILRHSGARALVCSAELLGEAEAAAEAAGAPVLTVGAGDHRGPRPALDELAATAEPMPGPVPRAPGDVAVILYTSGTTGRPKGAAITHLNLVMNVGTTMLSPFEMSSGDVLLGCLPLSHTFGQICGMGTSFRAGARLVLMRRFTAEAALDLMETEGCTVLMGVPTMYFALVEAASRRPVRPRLDRAYSGGAALPVRTLDAFETTFGCPVYEGYGLTETSPCVAYNQRDWPRKPGTVGKPVWGVEVGIARPTVEDAIEPLPAGEVGEIVVRGHNLMAGYVDDPRATAAAFVAGWFRTGDLGLLDDEGYLTVVDRKKDVILRGGYNVYPREVEDALLRHPAVARVAVVGVPDPVNGQEVCAVVVPRDGLTPDAALADTLVTWGKRHIAAYRRPRRVVFLDHLPLGAGGKVLKRELTTLLQSTDDTGPGGRSTAP
ncbi:long-chain-fatty-acid--CoA ligase [Streptomyces sp. DH41]|uniref:long-chain-fatty-acid--CoA ligase n=1 Tax=Streptomyces sp. DH41 TaxID=3040125 RepID=UPI002442F7C6|nr:long-chain fatty acid--CoA ligase [Streptomyces sp. DH41]MDG9727002.1 long-chain fatty acid--CoA ligase [Streptomyces sp. DH41]